jgi:hypothetical protein
MRYLKRQTLDRRSANNTSLYTDAGRINVYLEPTGTGSVVVPKGNNSTKPSGVTGMIRYNTETDQFEGYQSGAWRTFRFKESTAITQQNLGAGNGTEVYFGPLNPAPPATIQSGGTWGGQNLLVIVENVLQLHATNYTVLQNPTLGAETYSGVTSASAASGAITLYFNTALVATGASGAASTVTLTFSTRPATPFSVGSTIVVTGFTPSGYNGTFTVTACTTTSVSYTNSTTATVAVTGQIASTTAVYPSANFTSAIITGPASLQASTAVTAFAIDADTNALVSATFTGKATTNTIAANVSLTVTEAGATGTGYYLKFSSPVPYGKIVTALIGFDQ